MKRSLFTKFRKGALLAVPTAALMLGAAQAQTTIGLNFQAWYYDSGANPQTVGFGTGYQTTGFPVTAKAFGVAPANWFNTDPLDCQAPISGPATFGGVNTTFAGNLSANLTAPNAWQSGIGEQVSSYFQHGPAETVAPGNNEVTWGYLDSGNTQSPSVSVAGLAAKFPNGYVIQTIAAEDGATGFNNVEIDDGVTTNTMVYSTHYVSNPANDGYDFGGTVGVSTPSGVFTNDTININCEIQTTGNRSTLAGFIITDQPVVSQEPASGGYVVGQSINLSVGAIGIPPLSYQWRSNGIPVPGATSTAYSISSAAVGSYAFDVIATNLYGSATSDVASVTLAVPANLTWDADTGTTGAQDGSGAWDNGITTNWWNASRDVVWGGLDNAVFGAGGTGAYTVTVAGSVSASGLIFNTGSYTIAGTGLTLAGEAQIVVNTNASISLVLAGNDGLTMSGTGTLNLTGNNTFTGDLAVNGGTLQGGTTQGNASSGYLGAVNGTRTITVASGATIAIHNNNVFGGGGMSAAELPSVVLDGGTFNSTRYNSIGDVVLNSGGTLSQSASDSGSYQGYQFLGTITAGGSSVSTISTGNSKGNHLLGGQTNIFNVANVSGDANSDLIVSAPLIDGSGDYPGVGAIAKSGGGTLELAAVNTYTGSTTVSNGTLLVSGQLTSSGDIILNDATALNIAANLNNPNIPSAGTLTLGSSGTSTNALGFANLNSTTVVPVTVGTLSVINPVKINITGAIALVGSYPLIQYGGESGAGRITLGALPSGVSATLVDDHSSSVSLNVTATPVQSEVWAGTVSGVWDVNNTANWKIGAVSAKFEEGNAATFDDTASGMTAVSLNTVVYPAIVTFNNAAKTYSLSGSGSIAGATSLSVNGTGTVTLGNSNNYTGGTIINAGTLAVGADANLGTGALILNGGTLDIIGATAFASAKSIALNNSGAAIQVDNPAGASVGMISGGGALTKTGNGTLIFSAQQTYTGGTTVNGGILDLAGGGGASGVINGTVTVNLNATLKIDTGDAFGYTSGGVVINNLNLTGGTLNINSIANQTLGSATINMTGGAITGLSGANLDFFGGFSALNTLPSSMPSTISGAALSPLRQGPTIFDVAAGSTASGIDLDISSVLRQSPSGDAAGAVLTKADTGTLRLSAVNTYAGGTEVQGGRLILTGRLVGGGAMTVDDGAELDVSSGVAPAILTTTSDLTLGQGGGVLTLGFANVYSPTVPLISVVNVALNDAVTVNISGPVAVGQLPLIKYSGALTVAGKFTLGTLPAGVSATLVTNLANQSVDLDVTVASGPATIIVDLAASTNYLYAGRAYNLAVVAIGSAPLHYQWQKDGVTIPGAGNTAMFSLASVTTSDSGGYSVTVTNALGSVQGSTNYLVVLPTAGFTSQLASYWPLNELSGLTAFDLAGTNNATYGGAITLGVPGIATGDSNTAVSFGGGTADARYSASLNTSTFTLEFWAKPNDTAAAYVVALQDRSTGSRIGYAVQKNNFSSGWDFSFGTGPSSYATISSTESVVAGKVYFIAVTYDGTRANLYVNGVLEASSATTYQPATPGSVDFTMGSRNGNTAYNGVLQDVRFYGRALALAEISALAAAGPPVAGAVNPNPTNIIATVSSGNLNLSWPADHTGWRLLVQTNHLSAGLSSNPNDWGTVPGADSTNQVSIPISTSQAVEFYRLVYP